MEFLSGKESRPPARAREWNKGKEKEERGNERRKNNCRMLYSSPSCGVVGFLVGRWEGGGEVVGKARRGTDTSKTRLT